VIAPAFAAMSPEGIGVTSDAAVASLTRPLSVARTRTHAAACSG